MIPSLIITELRSLAWSVDSKIFATLVHGMMPRSYGERCTAMAVVRTFASPSCIRRIVIALAVPGFERGIEEISSALWRPASPWFHATRSNWITVLQLDRIGSTLTVRVLTSSDHR